MPIPRTEHRAKIAEARNVLGEVISRARYAEEPTILVNRGKEAAVIVSHPFYEQAKRDRAMILMLEQIAAGDTSPEGVEGNRFLNKALTVARLAAES